MAKKPAKRSAKTSTEKKPTAEQLARLGPQLEEEILDAQDLSRLLRADARQAVQTIIDLGQDGLPEMRYLVRLYYQHQKFRIHSGNVIRRYHDQGKSHTLVSWAFGRDHAIEKAIAAQLAYYAQHESTGMGQWCAPEGSEITTSQRERKLIEDLHDGDRVVSFDRHHAHMTRPNEVRTAWMPYSGDLVGVRTSDHFTETTPNHNWITRLSRRADCFSVYLMRSGDRFRVGRCGLFTRRGKDYLRLGAQARARSQQAAVWILKIFSSEREAAIYEHFISAQYGLTEFVFRFDSIYCASKPSPALRRVSGAMRDQADIDRLFAMFDSAEQYARAQACLADHGRDIELPLWQWTGSLKNQSPTYCLETAACNLLPEVMEVAAPSPTTYFGAHWLPLIDTPRRNYEGLVYSLNVAQFHNYIQNGLITCNSMKHVGIGPVIATGLLANIDRRRRTVSQLWSFAGLNPEMPKKWGSLGKRPFNADLHLLGYKIGHSFMMVHNRPGAFYGQVYKGRKDYETERNLRGDNAVLAAKVLSEKNFGEDTNAKAALSVGRLPDAQIEQRAERYACKMFLANWLVEAYRRWFGEEMPEPVWITSQHAARAGLGGHHYLEAPK